VLVSNILIIYSSVHGQTRKICEYLKQQLETVGNTVTTSSIDDVLDLTIFDKIILGASIRNGKHNPSVYEFISHNRAVLDQKVTSFFSVNLVARKPAKNTVETNPYTKAFLDKTDWRPTLLKVVAGNLDYQGYGAMDRNIIRFIMWITKGPTDANTKIEYTDWVKLEAYAQEFHAL